MTDPTPTSDLDPLERIDAEAVLVDETPPPLAPDEDGIADIPELGGEG
jgi:hypothetical protein